MHAQASVYVCVDNDSHPDWPSIPHMEDASVHSELLPLIHSIPQTPRGLQQSEVQKSKNHNIATKT